LNLSYAQHGEVDFLNPTTARSIPMLVEGFGSFAVRA
jgi:hypothetical protein